MGGQVRVDWEMEVETEGAKTFYDKRFHGEAMTCRFERQNVDVCLRHRTYDILCMSSCVLLRYHVHYRYRDPAQAVGTLSGCFQLGVAGENRIW